MASPIVAIGASAGGLEAVSELLAALPRKSDMAYVVVQHLDPGHHSLLAELLAKKTAMPVVQVHDGVAIEPSHVYVIPPNATLTLLGERLHLRPRPSEGPHHPVDILFTSLAEARADAAIGVVLSGGDSDGSLGVQAIKDAAGSPLPRTRSRRAFRACPATPSRQAVLISCCVPVISRTSSCVWGAMPICARSQRRRHGASRRRTPT